MPDEVVAAIAVAIFDDAGYAIVAAYAIEAAVVVGALYYSQEAQRKAQSQAKDAYNAGLRDRYVMVRGGTEPRQLVLGRVRVSGPMFYVGSYGANREHLTFLLALAAHEIDAVEQIYFDDMPVILDGSGNVLGVTQKEVFSINVSGSVAFTIGSAAATGTVTAQAVYGTTVVPLTVVSVVGTTVTVSGATNGVVGVCEIRYQPNPSPYNPLPIVSALDSVVLNGSGNGSVTLAHTPVGLAGYVWVTDNVSSTDLTSFASLVGNVLTITGGSPSITASVQYMYTDLTSRARVRTYLGAPGQVADAGTITNFPGVWTSAHTATGCAYLVVELDYDPTAFPGGIPNVSALVRGAKVYDPRTGTTAWSDNIALLMRHYATSPLGGRQAANLINDTSVIAAANVCDTSTNYVVNGQTYTRALYRGGTVAKTTVRPQDVLNDLAVCMAGKWAFVDGAMRIKAGSFTTPVLTLDDTWLHEAQQVHVQPKRGRSDVINAITATFADESQNYQIVQMPQVTAAAYVTEDGATLPLDMTLATVQFNGQAQHIAGCMLRDSRAGLQLTVLCNMKAYPLELFDVINVSLSRFGWVNKTFEVLDINWSLSGGIQLSLKETDASITAVGAAFLAFDAGKATRLPSPFKVADIAGLTVTSGAGVMATNSDGTVLQRMLATWTAATDPGILDPNGGIEVRYGLSTLPDSQWTSVFVDGRVTQAYLPNVQFDKLYLIKARGFNALATGQWCPPILHQVGGVSIVVDTPQIAPGAATVVTQDNHDFARVAAANGDNVQRTVTITPSASCVIQFTATMDTKNSCADSGSGIYWAYAAGAGADVVMGADGSTTGYVEGTWPCSFSFNATAGVSLAFKLRSKKAVGITGPTLGASSMTIIEIRR